MKNKKVILKLVKACCGGKKGTRSLIEYQLPYCKLAA